MHARLRTAKTEPHRVAGRLTSGCAALALLAQVAGAQDAPAPAEEPPRRYTVELIVFEYDESVSSGNEVFAPLEPLADPLPELGDRPGRSASPQDLPRNYGDDRVAPLDEESPDERLAPGPGEDDGNAADPVLMTRPPAREWIELELHAEQRPRMNEIYGKLVAIDAYQPLMRAAWTQTTRSREGAPALHLQSLGSAPPGLDGTVTLYAGRFVHLVLDLALDAGPRNDAPAEGAPYRGDNRVGRYDADPYAAPLRYRLEEDRIMRIDEIRYFDHPRLGVIARVTLPEDDGQPPPEREPQDAVTGSD